MNLYNRMAMTIVRIVAGSFFLVGFLNLALYWFTTHHEGVGMNVWRCVYLSVPIMIGLGILVKSTALANWVDQYLDE